MSKRLMRPVPASVSGRGSFLIYSWLSRPEPQRAIPSASEGSTSAEKECRIRPYDLASPHSPQRGTPLTISVASFGDPSLLPPFYGPSTLFGKAWAVFVLAWLWVAVPVQAQEVSSPERFALHRISQPIELDGLSTEAAWDAIEPLPMTMYQPAYEGALTERTEIRIAYDAQYLYASGRFYDTDPAGVRSNSLYRDRYSGDDTFALVLDTFNDNENALWFYTSPAGVRFDQAVANDAEFSGGQPINESWNTHWDVATVQTDEGWFAELRIPFSSLGFQDDNGRVVMGVIAYRFIARKNERHVFPAIAPNWNMGFAKPSLAQDMVLEGVEGQRPLYVTPYTIGGFSQEAQLNDAETAYDRHETFARDLGLDLKYSLTNNLTLDATVNTDFAQVEADDQQVNLTRFSLFFPEKRQFFQERAGIFSFNFGRQDRLFHSRRIGISDGQPVRILGGARLIGRLGGWDVGLIDMQTGSSDLPSENFGVLRLRRTVFNENSYAGGIFTSRLGTDGSYNLAYGLDGSFRLAPDRFLTVKWAQTFEDDVIEPGAFDFLESGIFYVKWENRGRRGLGYNINLTRSGADYQPEIGFAPRSNFTAVRGWWRYGFFPGQESSSEWFAPGMWGSVFMRNDDGTVESAGWNAWLYSEQKSGATINPWVALSYEDLRDPLELTDDVAVPAGKYTFFQATGDYEMASGRLLRADVSVGGGTFYDGWQLSFEVEPTWNLSRFLELSGAYEYNRIRFPDRDQRFDAHIVRVRTQVALNTKVSANVFAQYNSAAAAVTTNLRFRYNFAEGNDLWIVYNEGLNTDRYRGAPVLPLTNSRTLLVKYTHTFRL